ncbi:MAG: protein kinase domain-containing protein [bacterium]
MINQTVSHYRILDKLGQGGMGVVYKAEDLKLKRSVALKFLPTDLTRDEDAKERFVHEAQAASALDHPNICSIHEIEETEDGQLFIVMAYYEGETLQKKVDSGSLIVDSAIDIAIQIAQGLAKAHAHGIVHRDLKPANIIVTKEGVVKIVDFGLALLADRPRLTKTGSTVGTMAYMSPEQARGEQVNQRTDIWSLGVVLYEMITGQLPFKGDYEHAVLFAILKGDPRPISDFRSDAPVEIELVIEKALAKNPGKRYQRVDEMLSELKSTAKILESKSARIVRKRFPKRKRVFLYACATVFLFAIAGSGLYFFPAQKNPIDSIAVLPLANLSGDANQEYFADGMTEALISVLGQIEDLRVISRTSVMQYKGGAKSLPVIAQELNVDAILEGSAVSTGDRVGITVRLIEAKTEKRLWSQSFERELRDVLNLQREMALAITNEIESKVTSQEQARLQEARAIDPEAYKFYLWGRHFQGQETVEGDKQAAQHFERAIAIDPNFAQAYAALPVTYWFMGLFNSMPKEEARAKARSAAAKAVELDKILPEAHLALAIMREIYDWDWPGAEEALKRAIQLKPNSSEAHLEYGLFLSRQGRTKEGVEEIRRALALDPVSQSINSMVAEVYTRDRQFDEAITHCRKILQVNPRATSVRYRLGLAYLTKGSYDDAITTFETDLEAMMAYAGVETLGHLGCAYALSGMREKALKLLDEIKGRLERGEGPTMSLAFIYIGLGETDNALTILEREAEQLGSNIFHFISDPLFEPVRAEPRYQALLKKMGLQS